MRVMGGPIRTAEVVKCSHRTKTENTTIEIPSWLPRSEWPFRPQAFESVDGRMHFVDEGQGHPWLLVHGTPTFSFDFRYIISAFRSSARMLALDHLGFGLSDRPLDADYRPKAHARRFSSWANEVVGTGDFSAGAHDFGCPIALGYLMSHVERVRDLVVINSFCFPFDDDPRGSWRSRFTDLSESCSIVAPTSLCACSCLPLTETRRNFGPRFIKCT